MAKPIIHAKSSAKRFGGKWEDYIAIHDLMDSSKGAIADNRHRTLTHNSWFISVILEKVFGHELINSDGRSVSVRDIGEQHILEDFRMKFIPTPQDYLVNMTMQPWMNNAMSGDTPSSSENLSRFRKADVPVDQVVGVAENL